MRRGLVGTAAFTAALSVASCAGGGAKHSVETLPRPSAESTVPTIQTKAPLNSSQMLAILKTQEQDVSSELKDPTRQDLKARVASGVCAIISNIQTSETFIIPNPRILSVNQPDGSGEIREFAADFAFQHRAVFGPPITLEKLKNLETGDGVYYSASMALKLIIGPEGGQDQEILVRRTATGSLANAQTGRSVMSVRAAANIEGMDLNEFASDPNVRGTCTEAWTGVRFQPAIDDQAA